ncbi:MAG: hypothetical protein ACOCRB_01805 [Halanaerobiaceae bacterium]
MSDEIKQLINMVADLKETMTDRFDEIDNKFNEIDNRFNKVDDRFNDLETAIKELNETQVKILNSMRLIEKDVRSNKMHIERLEEKDLFL